jgi:hypothetical protein
MGLKKGGGAIYLGIVNGKLARRYKEPNPNTVTRTTIENTIAHEEYFKSIEGRLAGLDKKSHDKYGDTLLVYIADKGELYCIQMSMAGSYATIFLKTLPNVNLDEPVELIPSEKVTGDGKKDQTLFVKQGNAAVKRFYTKETPHGMPEPVLRKKGKKEVWEWDDQIAFLEDNVYTQVRALLRSKTTLPDSQDINEVIPDNSDLNKKDDLPF